MSLNSFLDQLYSLWQQFLTVFPDWMGGIISLVVFVFLIKSLIELVKKSFIWLILLIIFVPASLPLLQEIGLDIIALLQKLLPQAPISIPEFWR